MRDPARIDVMLAALADYWRRQPDMRLSQIVVIATGKQAPEAFHTEDDITLRGLIALRDASCTHADTKRGKGYPLRYGSHQTEVCKACGSWRTHGHDQARSQMSAWRPASEYAEATAERDDEES